MSNLPEQPAWESGIHQLEESERAKAGPGGILNLQATQLANRTFFLRTMVESIPDYREYTFFPSENDPDGTIAGLAGTPAGNQFRVILFDAKGVDIIFRYYLNESGTARFINEYPSARYLREAIKDFYQVFQKIYVSQGFVE